MTKSLVGATLAGKYLVKRELGAGGMGAVYEGEHVEIGKRVAIKVIEPRFAASEEMGARFRREARAASAVESEHIVQVFDVGHDPEAGLYMVMELLNGQDLAQRLQALGGPLPVDGAVEICTQVARALARAHAAGVVHRDLKPANIFLTTREDGDAHAKILDFGISKLLRDDRADVTQKGLTRSGAVIGTPQYMSPEQAQGQPVDARTDVWSLGAVLYEALAGRSAYPEKDTYEMTIIHIVTTKPRPLSEVAPWVPLDVAAVVDAALVHDVAHRMPDCATFAQRLGEAMRSPRDERMVAAQASSGRVVLQPNSASSARSAPSMVSDTLIPPQPTAAGVAVATSATVDKPSAGRRRTVVAAAALLAIALTVAVVKLFPARGSEPGALGAAVPSAIEPDAATTTATSTATQTSATATPSAIATPSVPVVPTLKPPPAAGVRPRPPATASAASSPPANPAPQVGGAGLSKEY